MEEILEEKPSKDPNKYLQKKPVKRNQVERNAFMSFFYDFPYSLFKQRRKDPVTRMHNLPGKQLN